jgi:hypothetical protein
MVLVRVCSLRYLTESESPMFTHRVTAATSVPVFIVLVRLCQRCFEWIRFVND